MKKAHEADPKWRRLSIVSRQNWHMTPNTVCHVGATGRSHVYPSTMLEVNLDPLAGVGRVHYDDDDLDDSRVVSLGSFSKILAPGVRLGWIEASPRVIRTLADRGYLSSGGCVSPRPTRPPDLGERVAPGRPMGTLLALGQNSVVHGNFTDHAG